jgi:glycosyltransferase involved in cell wall biosynthesis
MGTSSNHEAIKVLALFAHNEDISAVDIYRVTSPLNALSTRSKRVECKWMPARQFFAEAILFAQERYDIVIMPRLAIDDQSLDSVMVALRAVADIVVFETDDDYTGRYRYIHDHTCQHFARCVDYITVSTPYLGKLLHGESGKPYFVLPNSIEFDLFAETARNTERQVEGLNLMLVGTATHYEDWKPAAEAALRILDRYPHVNLLIAGMNIDYVPEREQVVRLASVPYQEYPGLVAQADIVLCSVDPEDGFNWSKSPIKAIEAWSAERAVGSRRGGAAVIATKSATYVPTVLHNHNGLLVSHDPDSWETAIELLITNELLRQKLQVEGYKDARTQHNIAHNWVNWFSAYRSMMEKSK